MHSKQRSRDSIPSDIAPHGPHTIAHHGLKDSSALIPQCVLSEELLNPDSNMHSHSLNAPKCPHAICTECPQMFSTMLSLTCLKHGLKCTHTHCTHKHVSNMPSNVLKQCLNAKRLHGHCDSFISYISSYLANLLSSLKPCSSCKLTHAMHNLLKTRGTHASHSIVTRAMQTQ